MSRNSSILVLAIAGFLGLSTAVLAQDHPMGAIAGTVTDAATSHPLAGASVFVHVPRGVLTATTNQHGRYEFDGVPAGIRMMAVSKTGYYPQTRSVEVVASATTTADFALQPVLPPPTGAVEGRVVNASTSWPLAEALVVVLPVPGTSTPVPLADATDSQGYYRIENVPAGMQRIQAYKSGYYHSTQEAEVLPSTTTVVNFALQPYLPPPTGVLEGQVVDASTSLPLAEALVVVLFDPALAWPVQLGDTTDDHGYYRIENVRTGMQRIQAYKSGYHPSTREAEVLPSTTTVVNFALQPYLPPPTGILEGQVVDALTSLPLAEAHVVVLMEVTTPGYLCLGDVTDSHGLYRIDNVPAGMRRVRACKGGYHPSIGEVEVVSSATAVLNFALRPYVPVPTGAIEGVVTDATTSAPIARAVVFVSGDSGSSVPIRFRSVLTNEHGYYRIGEIPAGMRVVRAAKLGYHPASQEVEVVASTTTEVNFALQPFEPLPTGAIEGQVVDGTTSAPVENAVVFVETNWAPFCLLRRLWTHTDANGYYAIGRVPVGVRNVHVFKRHYRPASRRAEVAEGTTTTLNFALIPILPVERGSVTGTVTDAVTSLPIAGAYVFIVPPRTNTLLCSSNTLYTQTNEQGQYLIDGAPAGPCMVGALKRGYHLAWVPTTVVANQTTTVDLELEPFPAVRPVRVIVRDGRTGQGVPGVQVVFWVYAEIVYTSSWNFWQQTSDSVGQSLVTDVPVGQQLLMAFKEGYRPASAEVGVLMGSSGMIRPEADEQTVTIMLEPEQGGGTFAPRWPLYR